MDTRFAISQYPDAKALNDELNALIKKPIYSIAPEALKKYEDEYYGQKCQKSREMIEEAKSVIPGGVQHNLAFNYPHPLVFTKAEGAKLYDIDGNEYYDLLQAGGPTILGSNDPVVREAVIDLLNTCGPSTGLFHEYEYKLGKKIADSVPSVDMFRMLGSGTEACMCAVRVARLATGKKNILKMGGAYHGWSDQLAWGMRVPGTRNLQSRGVPAFVFKHTQEFFPGDLEDLEKKLWLNKFNGGTAAVYIEPIGPESATRPVSKEFVKGVETLCRKYGALLVCDEVVSGFRIGMAGAQGYYGIDPDLTIFGKIIAGGYPGAGGVAGHRDVMKHLGAGLDSSGKKIKKAMCGGTMAATPISSLAGYTAICEIEKRNACQVAGQRADQLVKGINESIAKYNLPFVCYNIGSVCHLHTVATMQYAIDWGKLWQVPKILEETGLRQKEMEHMGAAYMAEGIVTLAGSRLYTSAAYTPEMIDDVIGRFDKVLSQCKQLDIVK
ncbi:MAG: aminotransferase class III-fold pyridoxal phosphate-dependent enzyme [Clostridia bacterium]|nr:aminotransferase class III-fold pyridoxal phosphate-dependent enzyme [Clostridia bacterium]MDO4406923.1 aminotransferase class III-fold pyridoxal phosphate-dependent enzyme [Eubacteriales bacterium]MEE1187707.1 aminotransferase class III-fold pyridoxal phosphate-dependent enzyme [Acutalibacteraceae bacterium]MBQ2567923.1 aminotransferase class III-fold pyridoxal phosphate-dependent enzyme [Clostridia bacterium]MBQ3327049.1 aminotransferase class III-fold pyridoxal phosphate-dependent enzyme 